MDIKQEYTNVCSLLGDVEYQILRVQQQLNNLTAQKQSLVNKIEELQKMAQEPESDVEANAGSSEESEADGGESAEI